MKAVNLLFPHQLFQDHPLYHNGLPNFLIEEYLFFRQFDFHKMKLAYHRASMKSHEAYLRKMKLVVTYIDANQDQSDVRVLLDGLTQEGIEVINYINPTDCWLEKRLKDVAQQKQVELVEHETHLFLNSDHD